MARTLSFHASLLSAALLFFAGPVSADTVQLANGDVLNGKVLTLDDKNITLESDSLGKITIARAKVATITLGNAKPPALTTAPKTDTTPGATSPEAGTVDEVLKQLKRGGVNPKDINELQKLFPELASPEASKYFDDAVKGLATGKTSIQDLRKDAIKARDELKKLTDDLGPDVGAATAPYLNILEKFIRETNPKDAKPESTPQPKEKGATPPEKK
jgi:hypothetical protein